MPDDAPLQPNAAGRLSPAPPSYRPQRQARGGLDPAARTLVIAAGGVLALLLLLVVGWALSGRHGGAVPTIHADKQPWRVKPDNPGGMQVAGANEGGGDLPGQPGTLAPAPEAPAPEALQAAKPERPRPEAPAAVAQPPAPPPASSDQPAPVQPGLSRPASAPAAAAPARPSTPAGSSMTLVQLAALDSEAGARTEWQRLKGRLGDVLADRQPVFQRIERDGHTLWRLRVGGFATIADATRFCERIRAGGAACELATF